MSLNWNLLYGFPHDLETFLVDMLAVVPLVRHLHPPAGLFPLSLDRFSPHVEQPGAFGISDLRPLGAYGEVYPNDAPVDQIAYFFEGEFESGTANATAAIETLRLQVEAWKAAWAPGQVLPALNLCPLSDGTYLLADSRAAAGHPDYRVFSAEQASLSVSHHRADDPSLRAWAHEARVGVTVQGSYIPLAVTDPETFNVLSARQPPFEVAAVMPPLPAGAWPLLPR